MPTKIEGFGDGDAIWIARVHLEPQYGEGVIEARPYVEEGVVFLAEHGLVQIGNRTPRDLWFSEVAFRSSDEAWRYCADRIAAGAAALRSTADECYARIGVASTAGVA